MTVPTKKIHIIEKTASLPFAVFSNEQRKKRVAAYARVSTEQDEQQSSYEAHEYYGAAEPPVRCGVSHLSGLTEPPVYSYSA